MSTEVEFTDVPTALYRLYGADGILLYIGITGNLPRRMAGHAAMQPWWALVTRKTMIWYGSERAARAAEAVAIERENPVHNTLRPATGPDVPSHGSRRGWRRASLLAWHPRSAGLEAWIRAEAQRRGSLADVLEEGMSAYRKLVEDTGARSLGVSGRSGGGGCGGGGGGGSGDGGTQITTGGPR